MKIKQQNTEISFPMRINKYLAWKKYSTRKGADKLIEEGVVFINGKKARLGDKVNEKDKVELNQKTKQNFVYLAYNKPKDVVTHSPQKGENSIAEILHIKNVFPIGRLDKDSTGLIILTNDGRITDMLLNPSYAHEKEYTVKTKKPLRANFKEKMEKGVRIENYTTKPCKIKILDKDTFSITLTEGKKHQIRRMCVALFNEVLELKRTRVMNIRLGKMPLGSHRNISGDELKEFLDKLGIPQA